MSLRHSLLFATLACTHALHAGTEFEDGLIPAELATDIAGYTTTQIYRDLPDNFPLPPQFPPTLQLRLLGSMQQDSLQRLFLRSRQSAVFVLDSLRQAYLEAGWQDLSSGPSRSGLLTLCHDNLGQLQVVSPTATMAETSFSVYYFRAGSGRSCSAEAEERNFRDALQARGQALFPVLEVPPQTLTTPPYGLLPRAQSFGGSPGGFHINLERTGFIEVPGTDLAALYEHFAAQLRAQGWQRDSGSVGLRSASSVWYHQDTAASFDDLTSSAVDAHGNFVVIASGDDRYRVSFSFNIQGGSGAGSFGAGIIGIYPGGFQ